MRFCVSRYTALAGQWALRDRFRIALPVLPSQFHIAIMQPTITCIAVNTPSVSYALRRVAHDSFVNRLLGLPWHRIIKYHRWSGNITLVVLYLHGGLMWVYWLLDDSFKKEVHPATSSPACFRPGVAVAR